MNGTRVEVLARKLSRSVRRCDASRLETMAKGSLELAVAGETDGPGDLLQLLLGWSTKQPLRAGQAGKVAFVFRVDGIATLARKAVAA